MSFKISVLKNFWGCCVNLLWILSHSVKFELRGDEPNRFRDQSEEGLVTDSLKSTISRQSNEMCVFLDYLTLSYGHCEKTIVEVLGIVE